MSVVPKSVSREGTFGGMYYKVHGTGRPLIALHGFGEHGFAWRHLTPPLARTHEVHVLDLLGHGRAAKPHNAAYGAAAHARRVAAYAKAKGLERPVLMGHSMGGGIALIMALDWIRQGHPAPSALVLVDSMYYGQRVPSFIQALRVPGLAEFITGVVPARVSARTILGRVFYDHAKITDEMVRAYAAPLETAEGRHAIIRTARQIVDENGAAYAARIREIESPTLLLWGREDSIAPLSLGQKLARDLPAARLVVVADCGHAPNEECPNEAVAAVSRFLASIK